MDSVYSHANWAADLGGVSYPLLADFHPKGDVARKYGVYLEQAGITDRATVIIDREGVVRYAASVTPSGQRNITELLDAASKIHSGAAAAPPRERAKLAPDTTLYMRQGCQFCRSVMRAITNLHCNEWIRVRDVEKDPEARRDLDALAGPGSKVPALVQNGKVQHESADIIRTLAAAYART